MIAEIGLGLSVVAAGLWSGLLLTVTTILHPMYASQFLWVIAQPLLLQNWIAGWLDMLIFIPFYFLRVRAEEKLMLDSFGDQYREYIKKVGGVIPKFTK